MKLDCVCDYLDDVHNLLIVLIIVKFLKGSLNILIVLIKPIVKAVRAPSVGTAGFIKAL